MERIRLETLNPKSNRILFGKNQIAEGEGKRKGGGSSAGLHSPEISG
jgi:hypothetical protein